MEKIIETIDKSFLKSLSWKTSIGPRDYWKIPAQLTIHIKTVETVKTVETDETVKTADCPGSFHLQQQYSGIGIYKSIQVR